MILSRVSSALLIAFAAIASAQVPKPADGTDAYHWVDTWVSMPQLTEFANLPPNTNNYNQSNLVFFNTTVRQTIHTSIPAQQIRLRFSNRFGLNALPITAVTIALPIQDPEAVATTLNGTVIGAPYPPGTGSALIESSTLQHVTFSGNRSITIPDQGLAVSDPLNFPIDAQSELSITMYLENGQASNYITSHPGSRVNSWYGHGNQVTAKNITGSDRATQQHWWFIEAVEAWSPPASSSFVIIGDSITDGRGSWNNFNNRWPDDVLAHMQNMSATSNIAVLNQGAGGNRVLADGNGPNAFSRVDRDVIAQPGTKYAMIFEGVNDIGTGTTDQYNQTVIYHRLTQAFQQMVTRMHTFNIPVFGATITPFGAPNSTLQAYSDPTREATRLKVNSFIRNSGTFDAVIDFDAWLRDPKNHTQLNPIYNSGDYLHPNEAGYQVIGDRFPYEVFTEFAGGVNTFM